MGTLWMDDNAGNQMTCEQLYEMFPTECPPCCQECHYEALTGYNQFLEACTEPCCTLIAFAQSKGLDPYEQIKNK